MKHVTIGIQYLRTVSYTSFKFRTIFIVVLPLQNKWKQIWKLVSDLIKSPSGYIQRIWEFVFLLLFVLNLVSNIGIEHSAQHTKQMVNFANKQVIWRKVHLPAKSVERIMFKFNLAITQKRQTFYRNSNNNKNQVLLKFKICAE